MLLNPVYPFYCMALYHSQRWRHVIKVLARYALSIYIIKCMMQHLLEILPYTVNFAFIHKYDNWANDLPKPSMIHLYGLSLVKITITLHARLF